MAGWCRFLVQIFACFVPLCLFPTHLTASPALPDKSFGPILQQFGIPKIPSLPISNVSKECNESIHTLTRYPQLMKLYLDALGKPQAGLLVGNVGWLGSFSECTKITTGAHYCLAYLTVPAVNITKMFPITWGICAPQQCSEQDITTVVEELLAKYLNGKVHLRPRPTSPLADDTQTQSVFCNKKSQYTTGVIVTLTLCGLILFLCLVGSIVDILLSFTKPHSTPVNKSDGFMPIRKVSIATDHDEAPCLPFGNDNPNNAHAIHPSPEVNVSGNYMITSFQQQTVKPNHVVVRFFLCFSLIQNTTRIMDTKVPAGAITSINGMRVLSMWWVILGHVYSFLLNGTPLSNLLIVFQILQRFTFEAIENATFSVDSFFFLSGLLVAYLSLRHMEKKNGDLPLFQYYFHRFWRLTPTYMFVLLFFDKLIGFLGDGPLWYQFQVPNTPCDKFWWTNLLYINNFYPTKFGRSCMPWAWYLANDMQFYVIAPAIIFTAYRFRLRGLLAIVGVLLCVTFITTAVIYAHYDLKAVMLGAAAQARAAAGVDSQSLTYVKPYCRFAPYLVGMLLGYLLLHTKDWKMSKVRTYLFNVAGWCIAIVIALSTLYGQYKVVRKDNPQPFTDAQNIIYGTFSRCAWSLALAWVVFACHRGLGGLVDEILSARFWIPLSRLTYCAYLVHPIALLAFVGSFETVRAYSDVHIAYCFTGVVVISYAAAFIVSVCVEFPMMQLEKLIFKTNR